MNKLLAEATLLGGPKPFATSCSYIYVGCSWSLFEKRGKIKVVFFSPYCPSIVLLNIA